MANRSNSFEQLAWNLPAASEGFLVRDLVRFLAVNIVVLVLLQFLLGLGFFTGPDEYVLTVLASKLVLLAYLIWLIRYRDNAWPETGITRAGRWWAWPASLAAYAAVYPLLLWFNNINHAMLARIYAWVGWVYRPEAQDVQLLLFNNLVDSRTRLVLLVFVVLVGPFMEELAFRGMGLDAFRRAGGLASAIVWTSLLFGLYHFSFQALLPLTLLGALFAGVRAWTGTLWCAVLLHCFHNALTLALAARLASL